MPLEVVGLSPRDAEMVIRNAERTGDRLEPYRVGMDEARTAIAYTHSGTITARSGTTVGTGVATLYRIDSSNVLSAVTDSAGANIVVTVKNLSTSVVGASKYIQIKREYYSGYWFVDFEDC